MTKKLWTFVVDFEGGTYVSQFEKATISEAIEQYNVTDPSGQGAVPLDDGAVPIRGTQGVFCATGLTEGDAFLMANIIVTVKH